MYIINSLFSFWLFLSLRIIMYVGCGHTGDTTKESSFGPTLIINRYMIIYSFFFLRRLKSLLDYFYKCIIL
ncbi:hypothetical protein F4815DRAFT_471187 [Daldinia loculata]|nr:hypothetical protein F4815DRAFT_471187 [Daldinia loculata]